MDGFSVSSMLVIGLNCIAWVWGAGRLMRSVESLEKTSDKLEEAVKELTSMLGNHGERIARLEGAVQSMGER